MELTVSYHMSTTLLYLPDFTLTASKVAVTACRPEDGQWIATLVSSPFHVQGGGQKGDIGTLGPRRVTGARRGVDGAPVVLLDGAVEEGLHDARVDVPSRMLNSAYHSAGHLLAVAFESFGVVAVQGHHWPGEARVEAEGALSAELLPELQARVDALVAAHLPIRVVGDPWSSRAIQIGDHAPLPCGGTHVSHTSHLAGLKVDKCKIKDGRTRVSYSILD